MRQWRILHTESSLGWGGQEVRVAAELEWMRQHGHWVALAAQPSSKLAKYAEKEGIRFLPLRSHKALLPFEILRLAAWMAWNRIDVVNTHSSNDAWAAGIAARLIGRPILIRSRHIEVDYPNVFISSLAYRTLPHHVLTTSQRIADRLRDELKVPADRLSCIATGVDLDRFKPGESEILRRELGLSPGVALIGMISVLRSWKGHATFLDAAAKVLQSSLRPAHFVIAGDGPGRDELEQKLARPPWKGHVVLLGHRADVPQVLSSLDVLVLPSYAHEGIPQIILQGQAMARAVVATTVGGIPEVITDGVNGLLVAPRNGTMLAEKILMLLENSTLRKQLGRAAREGVEQKYTVDHMGESLLALYAAVDLRRKRRRSLEK